MKYRGRCLMMTVLLSCMGIASTGVGTVMADTSKVIFTEEETKDNTSKDTSMILARGSILNFGSAQIEEVSSNEVGIFGLTQCHEVCDLVSLNMYLERKVDGVYCVYDSWDFYVQNDHNVGKEMDVLVPKESFYRLRTYHSAKKGVTRESTEALTKGIYIGDKY